MKKFIAIALLSGAFFTSCGEYNKVLKSTDYEYKYEAAKSYFGKGQYTKASTLLEELITILKGTEDAQESLYMLAMAYYNQGDYITASHYFTTYYNTYLDHILKANYPDYPIVDNTPLTKAIGASPMEDRGDSRSLFWVNPDYVGEKIKFENDIFENVQWFMYHGKEYAVGAKAGHNNEFHNHNDVGSFMISKNGVISFYDAGPGIYNKQYFAPETRYTIMRCSSLGHSAPIVNGQAQKEGNRGICDIYALDKDGHFSFDMKNAYVVDTLTLLKREFNCNEDYFTITDTYEFTEAPTALVERFVSREPVILEDGVIKTGNSILVFDSDVVDAVTGSFSAQEGSKTIIHHVDFKPKKLDKNMSFTFKFM